MSTITLYDLSIPLFKEMLASLTSIIQKGAAHPNASTFITARIHEDMKPFSYQVHSVTDVAQRMAHRLQGTEPLEQSNDLDTLDACLARIKKAEEILAAVDKDLVNSRAEQIITMKTGSGSMDLPPWGYVNGYCIPNTFFHLTTAYDILRKEGVPIGKFDYLTAFMGKYMNN